MAVAINSNSAVIILSFNNHLYKVTHKELCALFTNCDDHTIPCIPSSQSPLVNYKMISDEQPMISEC